MKLILSRKGFDSSAGGCASPILPNGRLVSLPIPDALALTRYEDIYIDGQSVGPLVEMLSNGKIGRFENAHLDPDLDLNSISRVQGWRPCFGQSGAACTHLHRQDVGVGDLFLFYGWFREAIYKRGRLKYLSGAPDRHVIFGWLQVGRQIDLVNETAPDWARSHPHSFGDRGPTNSLYVASARLSLNVKDNFDVLGAGLFTHIHEDLVLTEMGRSRSVWSLPDWFHPAGRRSVLSYHGDKNRWSQGSGRTQLLTVSRGQEFVLDCKDYPEAYRWLISLLAC